MRKIKFVLVASLVIWTSCTNSDQDKLLLEKKIVDERNRADSLQQIIDTLRTKYIFDNLTAIHIPNEYKPIKEGQPYTGKLYFVAFNKEDRVLFSQNTDFENSDTLSKIEYGGFLYDAIGQKGENKFYFKTLIHNETSLKSRTGEFDGIHMSDLITGK